MIACKYDALFQELQPVEILKIVSKILQRNLIRNIPFVQFCEATHPKGRGCGALAGLNHNSLGTTHRPAQTNERNLGEAGYSFHR
jgi:hypothetical protein